MPRLIDEDFRSFPIGNLPADISPIGEYHHLDPGYTGIWYEPNKDTSWMRSGSLFTIREEEGRRVLQSECVQALRHGVTLPMLVSGDRALWRDVAAAAGVRPLTRDGLCGLAFGYRDSRHFYLLALRALDQAILYRKEGEALEELISAPFPHDTDTYYALSVTLSGTEAACRIDGTCLFRWRAQDEVRGAVGMVANAPARFAGFTADMPGPAYAAMMAERDGYRARVAEKSAAYPGMRLERILYMGDSGAARSIRYGDLTGDGALDFVFIQNLPCLNSGDECMISCITAIDRFGTRLWQIGEPNPAHAMITADVPIQLYDIDGDGKLEVIYCKDFRLIIADGQTGATKRWMPTPRHIPHERFTIMQNTVFDRIVGDSIRIVNVSGKERASDILLKDRYNNIWVYDADFNLLFTRAVSCGHFPYAYDIDGDGRDEIVAGHSLIGPDGDLIWSLEGMRCHVDEIVIGRFDPTRSDLQIAMASGEDGFLLVSASGEILARDGVGHAQRVSVADLRPDLPGLEIAVTTFWRNTGIISYYDCRGRRLLTLETGANGNVISPVHWAGDRRVLLLYNASPIHGGLRDGYGDRVVAFPDDGHPTLCCDYLDPYGDGCERLLAWDARRMYIYAPDTSRESPYRPHRYPHHNYSNYRGEFSFPTAEGVPAEGLG